MLLLQTKKNEIMQCAGQNLEHVVIVVLTRSSDNDDLLSFDYFWISEV